MTPSHPLNKNLIHLTNGYHLKVKHVVGAALMMPFAWAVLIMGNVL